MPTLSTVAPSEADFMAAFNTLEPYIERRYGIPVIIKDVPNPFTGDLDGAEIHVDYDLDIEEALFIIAHLFGHTVQWNTDPSAREIGGPGGPLQSPSAEMMARLEAYERQACRYSLQLFHDAGVSDPQGKMDQWLSDFAACDFAYLRHFYETGDKPPFRSFWRAGQPLLTPLPIPAFSPTRWTSRWQGIVV